jgi:hypothetical protein
LSRTSGPAFSSVGIANSRWRKEVRSWSNSQSRSSCPWRVVHCSWSVIHPRRQRFGFHPPAHAVPHLEPPSSL